MELKCGCTFLMIADACTSQHSTTQMPVMEGKMGDRHVSVLRDTGCSAVVVAIVGMSDEPANWYTADLHID